MWGVDTERVVRPSLLDNKSRNELAIKTICLRYRRVRLGYSFCPEISVSPRRSDAPTLCKTDGQRLEPLAVTERDPLNNGRINNRFGHTIGGSHWPRLFSPKELALDRVAFGGANRLVCAA